MSRPHTQLEGRWLVVRADATGQTGTGHLMRCLALTQAWTDLGGRVRWLVAAAPDLLLQRVAAEGATIDRLGEDPGSPADAPALGRVLAADPTAVACIDIPALDGAYWDALGGVRDRILQVDDLAAADRYPGLVLNQNAHADRGDYPAAPETTFLLGLPYVLLRREFHDDPQPRPAAADPARRLLVTFGGADPTGMTGRTLEALRALPAAMRQDLVVDVVIGSANTAAPALEGPAGTRRNAANGPADASGPAMELHRGVTHMAPLMAAADLALTSGGSTVWELARMGCPSLVVETMPVEERLATGLARVGLFTSLGPEAGLGPDTLADAVARALDDVPWRMSMSTLGRRLVDGRGVWRVIAALAGPQGSQEDGR